MRTLLLAALLGGCATTQSPAQRGAESAGDPVTAMSTEPDTGNPPRGQSEPPPSWAPPPSPPSATLAPEPLPAGHVIARRELDRVLDASPGYFLQHVQTEPRFDRGRFHGWRVVSFFPGDKRFAGIDLQAGDVVTRVNGRPIEQPDEFMAVWTELRSSRELVVDVERNGRPRTLRWTISEK